MTPPLFAHQVEGCRWLWGRDLRGRIGDEPGCGKTRTALTVIREGVAHKRIRRALVVAPLRLAVGVWPQEAALWAPGLRVRLLWREGSKAKLETGPEEIHVTSFETFKILVDAGVLKPGDFDLLVVDESSKMKDRSSQITKALLAFGLALGRCIALSGTPAPNTPLEHYPQIKLVAQSAVPPFHVWRGKWFQPDGWGQWRGKGNNWRLKEGVEEDFARELSKHMLVHRKQDCLDLPPRTIAPIRVPLNESERDVYAQMEEEMWAELDGGGVVKVDTILAKLTKLRQLARGFVYLMDETGRYTSETGRSVLIAAHELLTEELTKDRPAIVVYNFVAEAERFFHMLGERNVRCLKSEHSEKDKQHFIEAWKAGEFPWLMIHPASCGHGLTLTRASEIVWLSPPLSPELWEQTMDRIHRIGQDRPCTVYALLAEGTADEHIFEALTKKLSVSGHFKALAAERQREEVAV